MNKSPRSIDILLECANLQTSKARDYQNPQSTVKQADYYPSGARTILEIVHAKLLRMRSLLETFEADPSKLPNFESIADSAKDAINYLSFFAAWCEGEVPGQLPNRDLLNRPAGLANDLKKTLAAATTEDFVPAVGSVPSGPPLPHPPESFTWTPDELLARPPFPKNQVVSGCRIA